MGITKQTISVRLDEETLEKLKELADKDQRTLSNYIQIVLRNYIKNLEKQK